MERVWSSLRMTSGCAFVFSQRACRIFLPSFAPDKKVELGRILCRFSATLRLCVASSGWINHPICVFSAAKVINNCLIAKLWAVKRDVKRLKICYKTHFWSIKAMYVKIYKRTVSGCELFRIKISFVSLCWLKTRRIWGINTTRITRMKLRQQCP